MKPFSSSGRRSRERSGLPSPQRLSAAVTSRAFLRFLVVRVRASPMLGAPLKAIEVRRDQSSRSSRCRRPGRRGSRRGTTSPSAKQRTTWATASTSRMVARNWLPMPLRPWRLRAEPLNINEGAVGHDSATWRAWPVRRARIGHRDLADVRAPMVQTASSPPAPPPSRSAHEDGRLATFGRPTMPHFEAHRCSSFMEMGTANA